MPSLSGGTILQQDTTKNLQNMVVTMKEARIGELVFNEYCTGCGELINTVPIIPRILPLWMFDTIKIENLERWK